MADMLVKLYDLKDDPALYERLEAEGIKIKQALSPTSTGCLPLSGKISEKAGLVSAMPPLPISR